MDSITLLGNIFLILTVFLIGLDGLLSLLDRLGYLPSPLARIYASRDKRIVALTIHELGLVDMKPMMRQALDYWRTEALTTNIDTKTALIDLVIPITRELKADVGLYKKVELQYYIDLAEYTTDWNKLDLLSKLICSNLRKSLASLDMPMRIDKIAASPGNPALGMMVALHMQKPFVSVTPRSPLASDPISGRIGQNEEIILVHDVALTGYRLADVANALRDAGSKVNHAFVLVERTDSKKHGNETPGETLAKNGIMLHSILSVNDEDLAKLLKKRK